MVVTCCSRGMLDHKRGESGDALDVTFPPGEIQIRAYAPAAVFTITRGLLSRCQRCSHDHSLGPPATLVESPGRRYGKSRARNRGRQNEGAERHLDWHLNVQYYK